MADGTSVDGGGRKVVVGCTSEARVVDTRQHQHLVGLFLTDAARFANIHS